MVLAQHQSHLRGVAASGHTMAPQQVYELRQVAPCLLIGHHHTATNSEHWQQVF